MVRPRSPTAVTPHAPTPEPTRSPAAAQEMPTSPVTPDAPTSTTPSQAAFIQVATGENHTCALRSDGTVECWGSNDQGQQDVPEGLRFRQIDSGWRLTCGVTTEHRLACWGRNNHQQANPPDGQFSEVSVGWDHACAIGPSGANCWGRSVNERTAIPPGWSFSEIGAGAEHSCGLNSARDLLCWGKNDNGRANSHKGPFHSLAVGVSHTCALQRDGTAFCQGNGESDRLHQPTTAFAEISAGLNRTCGTLLTGHVECWDIQPIDSSQAGSFGPPGVYTAVSLGWNLACGISDANHLACWSSERDLRPEPFSRLLIAETSPRIELSQPVELLPWPSGGLAVADKAGTITLLLSQSDPQLILNLTDVIDSDSLENGMLSAAIDPSFSTHPFLYVYFTPRFDNESNKTIARLSRFPIIYGLPVRERELIILDIERDTKSKLHWGGAIRFGPDGMLFLGIGDGGCFECPQSLNILLGKIIRIDVRGATAERPYRSPDDNPMLGIRGARPEIWAYGLRNPWRMSFDPQDGKLWVGDVGEKSEEEVSIATPGSNLGWPVFEGTMCFTDGIHAQADERTAAVDPCSDKSSIKMPVVSYRRDDDCAVIGGIVYQGKAIPWLTGVYLFGDFCSGRLWALDGEAESGWRMVEIADLDRLLSSFGTDDDGDLFLLAFRGPLLRLVDAGEGYAPTVTRKALTTSVRVQLDLVASTIPKARSP